MSPLMLAGALLVAFTLGFFTGWGLRAADDAVALAVVDVPDDETPIPLRPEPSSVLDRHGRIVRLGGAS